MTSPHRVTFHGRPTLGMFSTLPVLLYFFQIEGIVDSGICNNFMSRSHNFYAPPVSNPQRVVSDPHSVPLTCDPS
jgi:hypothetical protein